MKSILEKMLKKLENEQVEDFHALDSSEAKSLVFIGGLLQNSKNDKCSNNGSCWSNSSCSGNGECSHNSVCN